MISALVFDELVRSAGLAADIAAINAAREGVAPAVQTRLAVEAAFAHAIGLGLVSVAPLEAWPALRHIEWSRTDVVEESVVLPVEEGL